ncbi:MAG TPA: LptA/OstA family protein [Thermoanaerobaculia bacterium]|nr:LptA/OstA family protein [Thermoanaerobaculia bacterium]
MVRSTPRPHLGRFRRLLLALLGLCVAVVVLLFLFGRAGAERRSRRASGGETAVEEGTKLIGKDFDDTFTQGERKVFRIRGESTRVDKDDTVFLDKVGLTLYDKLNRAYEAESKEGTFNPNTKEGKLWGQVELRGPGDLEVHCNQLLLQDKGNLVVTRGVVHIFYASKYYGRADALQVWLPDEVFSLAGDVRIDTLPEIEPPLSLSAEHAVYERKRKQIRVEKNAELRRGAAEVKADRISALLADDESRLTFLRALYNVNGQTAATERSAAGAPTPTTVRFHGHDLAVLMEPSGKQARQVTLDGTLASRAVVESSGGGVTRTLTAPRVEGVLADNVLSAAEAFEGVDIKEVGPAPAPAPARSPAKSAATPGGAGAGARSAAPAKTPQQQPTVRLAHGRRAQASFRRDGQLATVTLLEQVTYSDGEVNAAGDRAQMDFDSGRGEFFGNPVAVASPRGEVKAPHVIYTSADQLIHALGEVRARLEHSSDTALAGSALGEGTGPILVQSQEGYWRRVPQSFVFRGDVRAWRGDNLLLAPELRGERQPQGDQLSATGGVKTVWIPTPEDRAAASGRGPGGGAGVKPPARPPANPGAASETSPRGPITVLATEMLYRDGSGLLTYSGNVHVDQEGKTLTCRQLDVQLDKDHKAQVMTCTGQAKLKDPATGRNIDGEKAVYRIATRKVDITGQPVVMRDRDGNVVRGNRLLYSIDNGKVEVLGKDEQAGGPAGAPASGPAGSVAGPP